MRTILAFLLSFVVTNASAQITVDPSVRNRYDSAYKRLPLNIRKNIERTQNELLKQQKQFSTKENDALYSPSIAVVTLHQVDTLNKGQVKRDAYFGHAEKYSIMLCEAGFVSDTLGIILYPGITLDSRINIAHLIIGDTIKSEYDQWEEYDTSFRTNLQTPETNDLTIPFVTTKFVVSDKRFVVGKTIYGYADIVSEPYYKDDENFKSGYLARRLHFRYYFKFVVKKNST